MFQVDLQRRKDIQQPSHELGKDENPTPILEGLEEILTVIRGLPHELRRSLACTNIVREALGRARINGDTPRSEPPPALVSIKAYRQNALQEHLTQADSLPS